MAMVYDKDDELIYQAEDTTLTNEGTFTWDGRYENENGETVTIDHNGSPYRFVVTAFCGKDLIAIAEELDLDCTFLSAGGCFLKKLIQNKETAMDLMRENFTDSVLVVESHDEIEIACEERSLSEQLLRDIKQANVEGDEHLDINRYYESSPDPANTAVEINETSIDLMVAHKFSWSGDRILYPQEGNTTEEQADAIYEHGLKFQGTNGEDDSGGELLTLRTKDRDDMERLKEYLFLKTYDTGTIDTKSQAIIDEIEEHERLDTIATCNMCIRQALERIAGDNLLYPVHLEENAGKISAIGKANDIYCDFLRWYYPGDYAGIKDSYVDELLSDNIDIARGWNEDEYANSTIEDFRSDIEITEFEKVEANLTVENGGRQYNIPNYNKLQKLANNGAFIIGIRKRETKKSNGHYRSGHIVMLLPFDEDSEDDEGRGTTRANSGIDIEYPYAMECGDDYKRQGWLGDESFLKMKWYIYK
ncbi:MAG: hypothetical protein ACOCPM_06415 [Bacteroidales bacterium]